MTVVALERSLDVIGESSKKVLLYHLADKYNIDINHDVTLEQVEMALEELLGEAASTIAAQIRKQLATLEAQ